MSKKPVMLMILDGWGVAPASEVNAAYLAQTPNLDRYFANYPHTTLPLPPLHPGSDLRPPQRTRRRTGT